MKRRTWWMLASGIGALALVSSLTGLANKFAYDDVFVIQQDKRVHALAGVWHLFVDSYWPAAWGGDGYRPLTMVSFTLEWVAGHGSPLIFHIANVVLYVAMCLAVFWLLDGVLPKVPAWIAAALFAVHPVHVEAVANIVGQAELTVGLLLVVAMAVYVHGRRAGPLPVWKQIAILVLYALALLCKEHAITLLALVPLAEITVVQDSRPLRKRLVEIRPLVLGMLAVALAFLWVRSIVLRGGVVGLSPYVVFQGLDLSTRDRLLTMVGVSPTWLRLFYWPAHLATEYAPRYIEVAQGVGLWELPGLLLLLSIFGLFFATLRRAPLVAFGIGWVVITLSPVSNFVLPAGFIIAERTLLLPSLGAMVVIGAVIPRIHDWLLSREIAWPLPVVTALLLLAGAWRSAERQKVWYDDDVLFKQAVVDTPTSYRAHYMLGAWYMQQRKLQAGEVEIRKALALFPFDPYMAISLGDAYFSWNIYKPALNMYRWAITIDSSLTRPWPMVAWSLLGAKEYPQAKKAAIAALQRGVPAPEMHHLLLMADSAMGRSGKH